MNTRLLNPRLFGFIAFATDLPVQFSSAQCLNPEIRQQMVQVEDRLAAVRGQMNVQKGMSRDIDDADTAAKIIAYSSKALLAVDAFVGVVVAPFAAGEVGLVTAGTAETLGSGEAAVGAGAGTLVASLLAGHDDISKIDGAIRQAGNGSRIPDLNSTLSFRFFQPSVAQFRKAHQEMARATDRELNRIEAGVSVWKTGNDVIAYLQGSQNVAKAHYALYKQESRFHEKLLQDMGAQCTLLDQQSASRFDNPAVHSSGSSKLVSSEPNRTSMPTLMSPEPIMSAQDAR
jgi:hypothetical protein